MPLSNFNKIRSRSHFHTVWFGSKITVYFFLPTTHLDAHLFIRWTCNVLLPKVHCPSGHWCGVFHRDRVLTMYFGTANVTLDAEGAASWNKSNISAFLVNASKSGGGCQQALVEFITKSWTYTHGQGNAQFSFVWNFSAHLLHINEVWYEDLSFCLKNE